MESDRKAGVKKEGKKIEPHRVYKPQYEAHAHSQPASFFLHHNKDQADGEKSLGRKGSILIYPSNSAHEHSGNLR